MKLNTIMDRYDELSALLENETDGSQIVKLSKEQSTLEDVVLAGRHWKKVLSDMKDAEELMNDIIDASNLQAGFEGEGESEDFNKPGLWT